MTHYAHIFFDGYCSNVQGLLDWFELDLGFTELSFIQIDLCVLCVFVFLLPRLTLLMTHYAHKHKHPKTGAQGLDNLDLDKEHSDGVHGCALRCVCVCARARVCMCTCARALV